MTVVDYLNVGVRFAALSQVILLLIYIGFSSNPKRVKVVGVMFLLGVSVYLFMPMIDRYISNDDAIHSVWFFSAIAPSMLLLLVWFIFEEKCSLPPWLIVLISVSVLGSVYYSAIGVGLPGSPFWLRALKVVIAALVVYVVWVGRDNDLVETRSRIRNIFVLLMALQTLVTVIVESSTHFSPPVVLDTILVADLLICVVLINYFLLRLNPEGRLMEINDPPASHETTDPILVELLRRMREERLYADHDLRVGSLAEMLSVPEYKLRKKINQELGYRNFNQFVNRYRIEEAGEKLRKDERTPVLSIALDVGFRSISSFNTAFQGHFGVSPTKYRADILSNS